MASKQSDLNNRRRFLKNLVRFVKNPLGYFYWKAGQDLLKRNKMHLLFVFSMGMFFLSTAKQAIDKEKQQRFLLYLGDNKDVEKLKRYRDDYKVAQQPFIYSKMFYGQADSTQFVPNPVYLQNFRKYFEYL